MAESDDGSVSRRDKYYDQQRSSSRSERSNQSRPQSLPQSRPHSRPASSQLLSEINDDYTLQDVGEGPSVEEFPSPPVSAPSSPSPTPIVPRIPRRKQSLDKGRRTSSRSGTASRHGSTRSITRTGSRGRNIDEMLFPDTWENLNEIAGPRPVQNPHEMALYHHSTLEEERTESRESRKQRSQRSRRSSHRHSILLRRGTPSGRGTPGTDLDITALPTIADCRRIRKDEAYSRVAAELYAISYLILFSILGTLARLGLQWLTFYPGAPITFSEFWANVGGTLVMGFLAEDRRLFRAEWGTSRSPTPPRTPPSDEEKAAERQNPEAVASHGKVKKTIPLYIGLATGFCGSFTSFSSFMRDMFLAFVNDLPSPYNHPYPAGAPISTTSTLQRGGGYSFMAGLAVIILTITVCFAALKLGAHLAIFLEDFIPVIPFRFTRRFLDPLVVFLAWGSWLGAVFMAIWPPDRPGGPSSRGPWTNEAWRGQAIFACVFAPLGCLLRFYISLKLNGLVPSFPLGTFTVNIFGTAVLGMAYDLQHVAIGNDGIGGGRVGCQMLQGIMDGFCGALTTVSTWILEIEGLRRWHSYVYGFASGAVGLLICVVVMGTVRWTVGWTAVACVT